MIKRNPKLTIIVSCLLVLAGVVADRVYTQVTPPTGFAPPPIEVNSEIVVSSTARGSIKDAIGEAVFRAKHYWGGYVSYVPRVVIPAGIYHVSSGDLTPVVRGGMSVWGMEIDGAGQDTQLDIDDSTGTPVLDGTDRVADIIIRNLRFKGKTGNEVALRFATTNGQGRCEDIRIFDCEFDDLNGIQLLGSFTTSETKIERCVFSVPRSGQSAILVNNAQSVNHWWRDLAFSLGAGAIGINVQAGGCLTVDGLDAEINGGTLIQIGPAGPGFGGSDDGYWFNGVRTEFFDPAHATGQLLNNSAGASVFFGSGNFNVASPSGISRVKGPVNFGPACVSLGGIGVAWPRLKQ